jgi:nucleoside-diphosphate-sugar epimerase
MNLKGATIAISGVGGLLGLRMAERSIARGMLVRGIELDPKAAEKARGLGASVVGGDVCDPAQAREACRGAEIVFHAAAIVREFGSWELFERVNVGGTKTMLDAAAASGVRRFVHMSSIMVYGVHAPPGVDEQGPLVGDDNPYCQTKIDSERAALAQHRPGEFEVTAIRSGDVYGPGSIPWTVRPFHLIRSRQFFLSGGGTGVLDPVYIDNLLDGVFLAMERDATGEAINLTDGRPVTCREFFEYYARMLGRPGLRSLPSWLLWLLVRLRQRGSQLLGREPPMHTASLKFLKRAGGYSIERARQRLGYEPAVSLEEGMRRIEAWLKSEGMLSDG